MRLQSRFLLTIIPAVAIALLTLGSIVYLQMLESSRVGLDRDIKIAFERVELRAATLIEVAENNAVLLSDSAQIADWFALTPEQQAAPDSAAPVEALYRKLRQSHPHYREVRLISRHGDDMIRVADDDVPNEVHSEAGTDWFNDVGHNWGQSINTSVLPHAEDGVLSVTIARPIRIAKSGLRKGSTLFGYVVLSMRVDTIGAAVTDNAIGHDGYVSLLDEMGGIVYAPEGEQEHAPRVAKALAAAEEKLDPDDGIAEVKADRESLKVAVADLFDGIQTLVVLPGSVVTGQVTAIGKTVALVTCAAIIAFGCLFFGLVRSVIVKPIKRLQVSFLALGEGMKTSITDLDRDDEIGDLATSFRQMSLKLSDSMSELRESHARIESLAYEDGLTGLANRRRFLEQLSDSILDAEIAGRKGALLFLDLDDFKRLNDGEGHRAGDQLLQEVAARASDTLESRNSSVGVDRIARIGGDEFVLLLDGIEGSHEAHVFAEQLLDSVSAPMMIGSTERVVCASVGIALFPEHADEHDALIACADAAMYEAKRRRTHSWCMYSQSMRDEIEDRLALEKDLRAAIGNHLHLQYQPQYLVEGSKLWGMEALLRWEHPDRGLISPADFIPVAEDTGLIVDIGNWVMDEACRQWTEWNEAGIAPDRIAVNVSQRQFALGDVAASVEAVLEKYNMPPSAFELEITESCIMDASTDVIGTLEHIRNLGVHVAMDDFGTGHSSLGALTQLPIDTLKVDRCFVSGIQAGLPNDTIVAAVLMLAETLKLTVVAEGVETESELARLKWHGCDVGQGYLLARPLWKHDATELLSGKSSSNAQAA